MTALRLALKVVGLSPVIMVLVVCAMCMGLGPACILVAAVPVYWASAILTYNASRFSGSRAGIAYFWLAAASALLIPVGYVTVSTFLPGHSVRQTQIGALGGVVLFLGPCLAWLFTTLALRAMLVQKGRRDDAIVLVPAIVLQSIGIAAIIGLEACDLLTEPRGGEEGMGRIILMGLLGLAATLAMGAGLLIMSIVAFSKDPALFRSERPTDLSSQDVGVSGESDAS